MRRLITASAALTLLLAPTASATGGPTLEARAILPADATFPAPFGGVVNTDPAPAPGATQPVGGFSALLDAGNGDFYAMPDNGFGSKANSRSFILRLYKVRPKWKTEWSGKGEVKILTSCPSCMQGLKRYNDDADVDADYIVVEIARHVLGAQWLPEYVRAANNGGIERVLV